MRHFFIIVFTTLLFVSVGCKQRDWEAANPLGSSTPPGGGVTGSGTFEIGNCGSFAVGASVDGAPAVTVPGNCAISYFNNLAIGTHSLVLTVVGAQVCSSPNYFTINNYTVFHTSISTTFTIGFNGDIQYKGLSLHSPYYCGTFWYASDWTDPNLTS